MALTQTPAQSQSQKQDVSDWSSPFPVESVSTKSNSMLVLLSLSSLNSPALWSCHAGIAGRTPAPGRVATCQIENHRKSPAAATRCVIAELRAGNCCTLAVAAKDVCFVCVCVEGCGRIWKDVWPKCHGFLHSHSHCHMAAVTTPLSPSCLVGECNKSWTGKTMTNVLASALHMYVYMCQCLYSACRTFNLISAYCQQVPATTTTRVIRMSKSNRDSIETPRKIE